VLDLSRLTPAQRDAVLAGDGPLVVVAGPGSGKTTVLAARIAYLVAARGVPPPGVLALAFATRAARELRLRLGGLLGPPGREVDVATFHAFGLRLLRRWGGALGWGPGPLVIYGADEVRDLVAELATGLGLDPASYPPGTLTAYLERSRLGGPAGAATARPEAGPPVSAAAERTWDSDVLVELARRYEAALRRRGAVDYAAMLALPLRLCETRPDVLRGLQDAYRHVLCDEAQDICPTQYGLLRYLAARHRNLTLVGDPLQAVFGWRGADAGLMLHLERDFPGARTVRLEHNFRATGHLVEVANALAARLPYGHRLRTDNPPGDAGRLLAAGDEQREADFVAAEVTRLCAEGRLRRPGEVGVLFRTNRQARPLVLALRRWRVPYRVHGGADVFARREVRDAVAYLRLAHNPRDQAALARVVNVPPRRLARAAALLRAAPGAVALPDLPALAARDGPGATAAARGLVALVESLYAASRDRSPAQLLTAALDGSGYRTWLAGQPDAADREEGLAALLALARQAPDGLGVWLADLHLGEDAAGAADDADTTERVLLTTVHGAKGGEWRAVFVLGMEEGLLPHYRALAATAAPAPSPGGRGGRAAAGAASLAEELRLAYVAMTRPRELLYVSYCRTRRRGDVVEARRPSRFLHGLPLVRVSAPGLGPADATAVPDERRPGAGRRGDA
jgi:DNA helicase-2/ATP-dependent DNA helicase PcrA